MKITNQKGAQIGSRLTRLETQLATALQFHSVRTKTWRPASCTERFQEVSIVVIGHASYAAQPLHKLKNIGELTTCLHLTVLIKRFTLGLAAKFALPINWDSTDDFALLDLRLKLKSSSSPSQ